MPYNAGITPILKQKPGLKCKSGIEYAYASM